MPPPWATHPAATRCDRDLSSPRRKARSLALDCEGTSREDLPASIKAGASIESHPDRREVISLTGEEKGRHLMGTMYILRPERGPAKLSKFELFDGDKIEGRFSGLLQG